MADTNWKQVRARLVNEEANPIDLARNLTRAISMSLDGTLTQKATAKGEVVEVIEVQPSAVAPLTKVLIELLKYVDSQQEEAGDVECKLVIGAWFNGDETDTRPNE